MHKHKYASIILLLTAQPAFLLTVFGLIQVNMCIVTYEKILCIWKFRLKCKNLWSVLFRNKCIPLALVEKMKSFLRTMKNQIHPVLNNRAM